MGYILGYNLLVEHIYIYICIICICVHTKFMGHASSKIDSRFCCVCHISFGGLNMQMQEIFMNHSMFVYFLVKL